MTNDAGNIALLRREIISHVRLTDMVVQTNEEHQRGVAERAASFASLFGMEDMGRRMGLLHDKGKEQEEWQKYIQGVTGYRNEYAHIKTGPNHAYVGATIAQKLYPQIAPLIAQPIAGHHRGLYDYCDYIEETKRDVPKMLLSMRRYPVSYRNCQDLSVSIYTILFACSFPVLWMRTAWTQSYS